MDTNQWQQLVTDAVNGNKEAFEKLYKETERSVYFICLKLLGNEHNAKDVTQDTYMTALEKLSTLDDGANFTKWINGIAVNKCKMHFRNSSAPSLEEQLEQGGEFADDSGFIPDEYVSDEEKRRIIMNIIDTVLSDVQRRTVILYYYNGFNVSEIAELMECPEGTVTYRLSASRAKIKEEILSYEEKHDDRLHAVAGIPILTRILRYEAEHTAVPDIRLFANSSAAAATANNIASKASAGGKSAMTGSLKAKIIAGAISVAVVVGGITAGVLLSGSDENSPAEIGKSTKKNNTSVAQSEKKDEVTEQGGVKFWLTSQDFSGEPLTSLPENFTLLDVKLTMPITYEQLDEYYQCKKKTDDPLYGLSYKEVLNQEILRGRSEGFSAENISLHLYDKGTEHNSAPAVLNIYNFSYEDKTAAECFENNWWSFDCEATDLSYKYWGFSDEDVGGSELIDSEKSEKALELMLQKLGTPTYYCSLLNNNENPLDAEKDQFTEDIAQICYTLAWEYDNYVVSFDAIETIAYSQNNMSINTVYVMPKEMWTMKYEVNKEVNENSGRTIYFEYDNHIDFLIR
ncbi:MAG: sigma-70 family RNA polymerase sigma factor [Ruminococcus sp.]|nr:sigma-70 family RNA polymerase sigma factor [Ruminococcus sp.]